MTAAAEHTKARAIGLVKKIRELPPDMSRDWRKFCSRIGPSTKVRTKGAGSYMNFFIN
jgi:hypothetical protein